MKATQGRFLQRILGATLSRRCTLHVPFMAAPFSSSNPKTNETEHIADSKHDLEALNRFTSGRWLWNEQQQLDCRYVNFDLSTLLQLAASAIGSRSCTEVLKISEGQYNKVFQLTMDDGREIIAKLPNPNAGRPHFTTASEVATMDFVWFAFFSTAISFCAWILILLVEECPESPCSESIRMVFSGIREPSRSRVYPYGEASWYHTNRRMGHYERKAESPNSGPDC